MNTLHDQLAEIWIFDIDGVIADTSTKTILYPQIINNIEQKLTSNIPVCFNTGRSSSWVLKTIIPHFNPETPLEYLYSSCELGNVVLEFDKNNSSKETVLNTDLIPDQLSNTIKEIVTNSYDDSMFVDKTKKSILTIEMKDNFSQTKFEELQSQLSGEIKIILKNYHPGIHVRPSSSTIAIDIKPITSNKELGASRILSWLNSKKINLDKFCLSAFGDSLSDFQMVEFFADKELSTKFIYVGENNINVSTKYPTLITQNHYSLGTLEYIDGAKIN